MSEEGSKKPPAKKAKKPVKYCKAPQAPKRFKSAFIFFTMDRHKVLRKKVEEDKGKGDRTPDVAKLISEEWRNLKPDERAVWEEKARLDKERFEVEKAMYTGPWKIPAKKKSKKDPTAPKRPMSSFLSYSNSKRAELKKENPGLKNAEASKILAKMWHKAPEEEKREHIEREERLREVYKKEMTEWRARKKQEETEIREKREEEAMNVVTGRTGAPSAGKTVYTGSYPTGTEMTQPVTPSNNIPGAAANYPHHQYAYPQYSYQPPVMITPADRSTNVHQGSSSAVDSSQGQGTSLPQPPMAPQGYGYPYPSPYGATNAYYPPHFYHGQEYYSPPSTGGQESEQKPSSSP